MGFTELGTLTDPEPSTNDYFWFGQRTGDVNGDGKLDLLVAARAYSTNTGRIYIFFGDNGSFSTSPDVTLQGEATNNYFAGSALVDGVGFAVSDLDEDGYDDIIVGASGNSSDSGKAYIFFGKANFSSTIIANNADISFIGNSSTKKALGATVAIDDFNGDGNEDIALSSPSANSNAGAAYIYYGNGTKSFDTSSDLTLTVTGGSSFGGGFFGSGDINGDGYDDLVVTNKYFDASLAADYIFYGGANMDGSYDVKFTAEATPDLLYRAGEIKDIDHDGYGDICLGANRNNTPATKAGRVYCFFGSSGLSGTKAVGTKADLIFNGSAANDNFGRSLKLYDVNNDGNLDLIVGAPQSDGSHNGYVKIYLGNGTKNFDTTADVTITAADLGESGKYFSNWVSAGDLDNDGWPDLFVSSMSGGNGTGYTGRVHIFEVNHGTPSISLTSLNQTNQTQPTLKGRITDSNTSGISISKVQWSFENHPEKGWFDCVSDDGLFDSQDENFSCSLNTTTLGNGDHTVYVRSLDNNGLYSPLQSYATNTFTVKSSFSSSTSSSASSWTNSEGALRTFSPSLTNNFYTTNNLPSFKFTKAGDNFSSITKYQILIRGDQLSNLSGLSNLSWRVYLDDIPHGYSSGTIKDETDRYTEYTGDEILIYSKKSEDSLPNGSYLWKVKAFDSAGNTTDSPECQVPHFLRTNS